VTSAAGATVVIVWNSAVSGLDFSVEPARLTLPPRSEQANNNQNCGSTAPAKAITAADFVQLERSTCYGICPSYSVRIRADGQVTWDGKSSVKVTGAATATIDPALARNLIEQHRANGFWNLCSSGPLKQIGDGQSSVITVRIGADEKRAFAPANLAREIDLVADTHRWRHGDPQLEPLSFSNLDSDSFSGSKSGVTRLMQVSGRRGTASDVRAVLAAGADPNARDVSGWTALMYAMLNRDPEVIKALLEGGADPNARSRLGESVLMGILSQQAVSSDGAVSKVRLLVAAGANVNEQDQDGNTALMLAFRRPRNPDPETLRQLLQDSGIEVPPNFR
jgi:hypothetical protein